MYFLLTENCPFLHSCVLVWIRNPWPVNRQVLFLPILLLIIDIDLAVMALHHGLVISIMLSMAILPHCKLVATKPGPTTCSCPDHLPIVGTGRSSRHFLPDNVLHPLLQKSFHLCWTEQLYVGAGQTTTMPLRCDLPSANSMIQCNAMMVSDESNSSYVNLRMWAIPRNKSHCYCGLPQPRQRCKIPFRQANGQSFDF